MKNLAPITNAKDVTTKEYVDVADNRLQSWLQSIEDRIYVYVGYCSTEADEPIKEVYVHFDEDLETCFPDFALLAVYFTNANTADGIVQLKLYTSTPGDYLGPAYAVRSYKPPGTTITVGQVSWRANEMVLFARVEHPYDSGELVWQLIGRQGATGDYAGVVQLSDAINSTTGVQAADYGFAYAATPKAVKTAYDLAASKQDPITGGNGVEITDGTNVGLTDKFYNYLAQQTFEVPTLTLTMSGVGVDREIGTPLSITSIKHRETNIDSIKSETLAFYRDNGLVEYINPSDTEATVTLETEILENPTADAQHAYVLKCTDTMPGAPTTRLSNTVTAKWYRYAYSALNNDTTNPPVSGNTKQTPISTFASNGAPFNYAVGQCLWLFTTKADAKIQTNVLGQWADVTFQYNAGPVQLVQENGVTHTYYAYRTAVFDGAGTAKYRVS